MRSVYNISDWFYYYKNLFYSPLSLVFISGRTYYFIEGSSFVRLFVNSCFRSLVKKKNLRNIYIEVRKAIISMSNKGYSSLRAQSMTIMTKSAVVLRIWCDK